MKNINLMWPLVFSTTILINTSCKKTSPIIAPITPPDTTINKPPQVSIGADTTITIPQTSMILSATASDDHGVPHYEWKKISGPSSFWIDHQNNLIAQAVWMEEGVYEFEFTATDSKGLFDKDTIKVTVTSQLNKYIITGLTPTSTGFTETLLPNNVYNNVKWVYCKSADWCELADNGPSPYIDYSWGGWFYNKIAGDKISVYGGYTGLSFDLIVYY